MIQARGSGESKVCALVIRTGFSTAKGILVRNILFPQPIKFKFYNDSYKFIIVMLCLSGIGMGCQLIGGENIAISAIITKCLDLITIAVPPALPACLSIGISFSLSRMRQQNIFCISPQRINVAGKISIMCFDKTGTLTEEGLSVFGFRIVKNGSKGKPKFRNFMQDVKQLDLKRYYQNSGLYKENINKTSLLFVEALASCHSLTKVSGQIIGDPLDVEMFNATGWHMDETGNDPQEVISTYVMPSLDQKRFDWTQIDSAVDYPYQLGILRRFEFSSHVQRMSVIVQNLAGFKYRLYAKGAPETIRDLCLPESIPPNFFNILARYTRQGLRVLALATRKLNINHRQFQKLQQYKQHKI